MVQLFPESVAKLWNEWDIRVMVLCSLCLQILLIIFGSRRKYNAKIWIRIVTWIAYLSADWVATVALGMISTFQGDADEVNSPHRNSPAIMAFWAPFLLTHLGGPDTITAYSLEDSELWLRHLLGLLVQIGVASYIFLRSWTSSTYHFSLLAIPLYVAGIIKSGERTWVLRSASTDKFRDSLVHEFPNPNSSSGGRGRTIKHLSRSEEGTYSSTTSEGRHLGEAYELFNYIFKRIYAYLVLHSHDRRTCSNILSDHSAEDVFKLIEIELGFMYDVLYTKASIVYSLTGIIFRSISLLCHISAFSVFCLVIHKQLYPTIDIILTYVLSVGAISLELYAIIILVSTDWTLYWLSKQKHRLADPMYKVISSFRSNLSNDKRWSESMAQFNLIDLCLKEKPAKCARIQRLFGIDEMLDKYWHTTSEDVPIELKQLIFELLGQDDDKKPLTWKDRPLDETIVVWHIATHICYNIDDKHEEASKPCSDAQLSKLLSEYMMYILVMHPSMLPKGIGQIVFRDTCTEVTACFEKKRNVINNKKIDREVLIDVFFTQERETIGTSVLINGLRLAENLLEHECEWGKISIQWIGILCYAASECGWKEHGQQLRRGGEFLTHVSLLLTNLGRSKHFRDLKLE